MSRIETAQAAYFVAFDKFPPQPWGVSDDRQAEVLEQAVADGKPLDEDFDWYPGMPPDAVA